MLTDLAQRIADLPGFEPGDRTELHREALRLARRADSPKRRADDRAQDARGALAAAKRARRA